METIGWVKVRYSLHPGHEKPCWAEATAYLPCDEQGSISAELVDPARYVANYPLVTLWGHNEGDVRTATVTLKGKSWTEVQDEASATVAEWRKVLTEVVMANRLGQKQPFDEVFDLVTI